MPELRNRVKETSVTTGTGDVTLAGPPTGFVSFNAALGIGTSTYYVIEHQTLNEWEIGQGVLSDAVTLVRSTVLKSSNADLAVDFSAGNKTVFIDVPAEQFITKDADNVFIGDNTFQSNLLLGSGTPTVGTSGVGVLSLGNSTPPTTQPADGVQLYAADYAAGDSRLQIWSESGTAIWIGNGTIAAKAPASGAGNSLTLAASAAVSGNTNGGDIALTPGLKSGSGVDGNVTVARGQVILPNGTAALPALSIGTTAGSRAGLYKLGPYGLGVSGGGSPILYVDGNNGGIGLGRYGVCFNSGGDVNGTANSAIYAHTAGVITLNTGVNAVGQAALVCGQPTSSTVGLKVLLNGTPTADAFQVLAYDGVTVLYKINKDGNPTVKSTVFFEDANGYITRTAVENTIMFSASSATDHMKLSAAYLDVLTASGLRLKAAADTTDGVICAADKGGNSGTGLGLLLHGGAGSYSATPTAGGYIKVYGGDGAAGNTNGGSAYVFGGAKFGSGSDGDVHLGHTGSATRGNVYLYNLISPFVTPAALTANVDNYAPPRGRNYRLSTDGGNYSLTGLGITQVDGQEVTLINIGSGTITLSDEDTGSTAANRFHCVSGASIVLDTDERADLIYDATSARWRVF